MGDVLVTFVVVLVLPVTLLSTAGFWASLSLRRANKVAPGRSATVAPLRWLWSPSAAASLHRRLRAVCQLASSIETPKDPPRKWPRRRPRQRSDAIEELAREVVQEAVQLDRELVTVNWLARGLQRDQAMMALDYQVRAVEDAARRVHELAARRARASFPGGPPALTLHERITAMESAVAELTPRPPAV